MGNMTSERFDDRHDEDAWWPAAGQADANPVESEADAGALCRREFGDDDEFRLEMARIREKRKDIIGKKRKEMEELREEVAKLRLENKELKERLPKDERLSVGAVNEETELLRRQNEELREILEDKSKLLRESEIIIGKNRELKMDIAEMQTELQHLNTEVVNFEKEREDYRVHVHALKDVISVSKHMLQIRESQLKELKEKVDSIEKSLSERETQVLSQDLRNEYERQLNNIRNLRTLYEERQRMERREKADLMSQMEDVKKELEDQQKKNGEQEDRISELETDNSAKYDAIKTLESNLGLSKAESRQYKAELSVINQLFSEILLGFNSSQVIDLDKLQKHLEDHHDLLQDIVVNEISSEVSYALPKVLLDLLNQVSVEEHKSEEEHIKLGEDSSMPGHLETIQEEQESASTIHQQMNSAEEIVENLPKVWRILIELLSHQTAPTNTLSSNDDQEHPCYKTVDTPKGPSPVVSVSRTFIRLKDLILEKKSLEKETNHLKQLNGHLENRLQDQEKRLELVHSELSKTWLVVGTLQKQHQMLHTQEKILRYELAQKRKLLNELKEELEESREKWAQAREKNSNTEQQWRLLRSEFASRKTVVLSDEYNNSGESGYSDDREGLSSDEEPGYETDVSECAQKIGGEDEGETKLEMLHEAIEDGASLLESGEAEDSEIRSTSAKSTRKLENQTLETFESAQKLRQVQSLASHKKSTILQPSSNTDDEELRLTNLNDASEIIRPCSSKYVNSDCAQKITEIAEINSGSLGLLIENENMVRDEKANVSGINQKIAAHGMNELEDSETGVIAVEASVHNRVLHEDDINECAQENTIDCSDASVKNHESASLEGETSSCSLDRTNNNTVDSSILQGTSGGAIFEITSVIKPTNHEVVSLEEEPRCVEGNSNEGTQKITSISEAKNHQPESSLKPSCDSGDLTIDKTEQTEKVEVYVAGVKNVETTLEKGDSIKRTQKITSTSEVSHEPASSQLQLNCGLGDLTTDRTEEPTACIQGAASLEKSNSNKRTQKFTCTSEAKNHEPESSQLEQKCDLGVLTSNRTEEPTEKVEVDVAGVEQGEVTLEKDKNDKLTQKIRSISEASHEPASSQLQLNCGLGYLTTDKTEEPIEEVEVDAACIQGAASLEKGDSNKRTQKFTSTSEAEKHETPSSQLELSCDSGDKTEEPTEKVEEGAAGVVQGVTSLPSTAGWQTLTLEEVLARRDERLRRLEGQASQLVSRVANTATRGVAISNRLDDLHEVYGQSIDSNVPDADNNDSFTIRNVQRGDDSVQNENMQNNEGND